MKAEIDFQQQTLQGFCLVAAPLLFFISTFFWIDGQYGVTAATLICLSTVFWIPALYALFGLLKHSMPFYSAIGLLIAVYGCCMGAMGFGMLGYLSTIFKISHHNYLDVLRQYPVSSGLLLFWAGPLFPLSLLVLAINLVRKKAVPVWLGLLIGLAAVAFPVSRILRISLVAHLADILLLLPLTIIGIGFIKRSNVTNLLIKQK
ncbi:hypothetical protein ACEN9X_25690 [Mucilaginibacter sp. Mucisp86]|uniref:hypothetical protein n=1 Tax=Mucilaginibacter sp. Mucisp86 TaxID=3243060 RepID=UPI0039B65927